jgi:hypothetical protein
MRQSKLGSSFQVVCPANAELFSLKRPTCYPNFAKISSAALAITVPGP